SASSSRATSCRSTCRSSCGSPASTCRTSTWTRGRGTRTSRTPGSRSSRSKRRRAIGALIARRLVTTLPAPPRIYTLVFVVLHVLPGDPALVLVSEGSASAERLESLRRELGFDRPLPEQYVDSLAALLRGDLGRSIRYNRPVASLLAEFFPYTLELTLAGL